MIIIECATTDCLSQAGRSEEDRQQDTKPERSAGEGGPIGIALGV